MFASHPRRRALALLLAGAALCLPAAGADAQVRSLRDAAALGAPPAAVDFSGTWVASPDGLGSTDDYVTITPMSTGRISGFVFRKTATGTTQNGEFDVSRVAPDRATGAFAFDGRTGSVELTGPAGKGFLALTISMDGRRSGTYLRTVSKVGAPYAALSSAAVQAAMPGSWSTPLGTLTIASDGRRLVGTLRRTDGSQRQIHSEGMPTGEQQNWRIGLDGDYGLRIVLAPDGSQFMTIDGSAQLGTQTFWVANKVAASAEPTPVPAPTPAPAAGQWQAFDGIWRASGENDFWLDIDTSTGLKIEPWRWESRAVDAGDFQLDAARSTATQIAGSLKMGDRTYPVEIVPVTGGMLMRVSDTDEGLIFPIYLRRVDVVGSMAGRLTQTQIENRYLGRWATSFGELVIERGGSPADSERPLIGKVLRPGGTAVSYQLEFDAHARGEGSEASVWRSRVPTGDWANTALRIALSPDGNALMAADTSERLLANLKSWTATRIGSVATPSPAPAPAPAPAPTPAPPPPPPSPPPPPPPPPVAEAPALPGTVQAGTFHSLEAFDVRLDEARAARDGTVHLFLTVRNDSGRDQQIGAGTFTAVISDADGVGVREAQIWRASGDSPTQFDRAPVVQAGGEFKFRFVLAPPTVHAPLQRVSIRESDKKVLFFSVAGADPNPSRAGAPAQGGGAFKSLSKFDVRIDRVARARDGLLEAYLTLRNPGTAVETTSKGWIKLSGSDADGAKATSRSALYSVRGERGNYDELPTLVYVEPGQQVRLRYVFDQAISGPITISDGTVSQTFTAG